uniref:Tyrosine specific protein phosphatases domain-containing protein n=1 Tax=Timema poppense TaxID=170557 RepID=A0A7R9HC99_TIMPO|nr:unnamed protein product [Timema poppensis]
MDSQQAGLGRTGTLIGAYLVKHYHMAAREAIAWLRICRPGCVIGRQQTWLEDMEGLLWKLGQDLFLSRLVLSNLQTVARSESSELRQCDDVIEKTYCDIIQGHDLFLSRLVLFQHYGVSTRIPHHSVGIYSLKGRTREGTSIGHCRLKQTFALPEGIHTAMDANIGDSGRKQFGEINTKQVEAFVQASTSSVYWVWHPMIREQTDRYLYQGSFNPSWPVWDRKRLHLTEIRTSISPSSVVELNTTSALANYATEAGMNPDLISQPKLACR